MTSELKKNLAAYESMKSTLESKERGRIALFSDGKLCDIFNDFGDGYMVGMERFGEGRFSVKRIGEPPVQLGAATLYANRSRSIDDAGLVGTSSSLAYEVPIQHALSMRSRSAPGY